MIFNRIYSKIYDLFKSDYLLCKDFAQVEDLKNLKTHFKKITEGFIRLIKAF